MLGTRSLVAAGLLLLLAGPAQGITVQAGWELVVPNQVVFIGDAVDINVTGPAFNLTVEIRLTDPNGTFQHAFFAQLDNGTATWNYTTTELDFPGTWRVEALVNGNEVAYAEVIFVFDELTFLSRRQAVLERRMEQQDGIVANLLADNHVLHGQLDLMMFFVPAWIVLGFVIFWWTVRYVTLPWYKLLTEIRAKFDHAPVNTIDRFIVWAAAPWGGSEQEQFHIRLRLLPEPKWPSDAMAGRIIRWKARYEKAPRMPVKKLRVVVKHRKGESS